MADITFRQHNQTDPRRETLRLRPVTVRQVLQAEPSQADSKAFEIEGKHVAKVSLVVHVVAINSETGDNIFRFEDGTGLIVAHHAEADIEGTDEDPDGLNGVTEGIYARAIGSLRRYKDRNSLQLKSIRPAEPSELEYHCLQVMVATLASERGPPPMSLHPGIMISRDANITFSSQTFPTSASQDPDTSKGTFVQHSPLAVARSKALVDSRPGHGAADSSTEVPFETPSQATDISLSPLSICAHFPARFGRQPTLSSVTSEAGPSSTDWPSQPPSFSSTFTSTPFSPSPGPSSRTRDPWARLPVLPRKILLAMYEHAHTTGTEWMETLQIQRALDVPRSPDSSLDGPYKSFRICLDGLVKGGYAQQSGDAYRLTSGPRQMYNFNLEDI